MTKEEFKKRINDLDQWMKDVVSCPDLTGDKIKDRQIIISDLSSEGILYDIYEVHVNYHLSNGDVIKTKNNCLKSYYSLCYAGDEAFAYDGWLKIVLKENNRKSNTIYIVPESVVWIETYTEHIDWESKKCLILQKIGLNEPASRN